MRSAHSAPATRHRQEHIWRVGHKLCLDLGCQHQVSEPVLDRRQRREDVSADPEVHRAHVGAFFSAVEAQSDASKIRRGHVEGTFTNAAMNSTPKSRSGAAVIASAFEMYPLPCSTATATTYPSFSTMLGIITGRNRTGFDPITRNAICHAVVTTRNP